MNIFAIFLKVTELYSFNKWIIWYIKYTSKKLLKKLETMSKIIQSLLSLLPLCFISSVAKKCLTNSFSCLFVLEALKFSHIFLENYSSDFFWGFISPFFLNYINLWGFPDSIPSFDKFMEQLCHVRHSIKHLRYKVK